MTRPRIFAPLLTLAILVGVAAGALTGRTGARAITAYDLYMMPGGVTNALTCGWHSACISPYSWGNALDWGNAGGNAVYWRSYGVAVPTGAIGVGFPLDVSGTCKAAGVDVYDVGWIPRGRVVFTHTQLTRTTSFAIAGGPPLTPALTLLSVGTTASTELYSCTSPTPPLWSGPHLHQYSTASGWYANTAVYPNAPSTGTGYNLGTWTNWQNRTYWYQ